MNTFKTESSFRYLKMQKSSNRGFIKSPMMIRVKNKPISKKIHEKCPQNCTNHRFSLRKVEADLYCQISKDINDVSLSFCPIFDHCLDTMRGGIPKFACDKRADTPCFMSSFQEFTQTDNLFYKSKMERMIANASLFIQDQKENTKGSQTQKQQGQPKIHCYHQQCQLNISQLELIFNPK